MRYYNSSIDSSPTRTAAALSALDRPVRLICGGYDKKIPYEPLAEAIFAHKNIRAVVTTGQTGPKIASLIRAGGERAPELYEEETFDGAFYKASSLAKPGDCVLLSPASASFDAFENFEKRGEHFADLANGL